MKLGFGVVFTCVMGALLLSCTAKNVQKRDNDTKLYVDVKNGFVISIKDGWNIVPHHEESSRAVLKLMHADGSMVVVCVLDIDDASKTIDSFAALYLEKMASSGIRVIAFKKYSDDRLSFRYGMGYPIRIFGQIDFVMPSTDRKKLFFVASGVPADVIKARFNDVEAIMGSLRAIR